MTDFFVSYTKHDLEWANWIAWELEAGGFQVVIQAWDFAGNWVLEMDKAIRDSQRTVAVLSPAYLDAMYTKIEWADAFRRDPTGEKGLLMPVRIAPVDPTGILADISYLDLVGKPEEEARHLLLQAARGERRKPLTAPRLPGRPAAETAAQHTVQVRPPYPADVADKARFQQARDLVAKWRGQHGLHVEALAAGAKAARIWRGDPPKHVDDDLARVIAFAIVIAGDLETLPVSTLEFAEAYGLKVHCTVFKGQALAAVKALDSYARVRTQSQEAAFSAAGVDLAPSNYNFEMVARVLEAATALAEFDVAALPRGYRTDIEPVSGDLAKLAHLFIARVGDDSSLQLMTSAPTVRTIGSFAARGLSLHALCGQLNREGSIDLLADDRHHVYYWQSSGPNPVAEFAKNGGVMRDAQFVGSNPGSPAVFVEASGRVGVFRPDGTVAGAYDAYGREDVADARIWVDPLDEDNWFVVSLAENAGLSSGRHGVPKVSKSHLEIWDHPLFLAEVRAQDYWYSPGHLTLATLAGLPCLIVRRTAIWGTAVCFLDPRSLLPLGRPLVIREAVGDITIAAGRWLVVTEMRPSDGEAGILVWDLQSAGEDPVARSAVGSGDVFFPLVVAESAQSFQTLQVFHALNLPPAEQTRMLCRFDWPGGKLSRLARFSNLTIWPVTNTSKPW